MLKKKRNNKQTNDQRTLAFPERDQTSVSTSTGAPASSFHGLCTGHVTHPVRVLFFLSINF